LKSVAMNRDDASDLSEIAALVQKRQRRTYEHDVGPYVGLGETVAKIAIRVPTKREQDLALAGAHEYVARLAEKTPKLADDPEILFDTKAAFIVAASCRRASNPDKMPAWPSGGWLHENLTSDQIAVLLRLVNEVREKKSPVPMRIDDTQVEAFANMIAASDGTNLPDMALAAQSHAFVVQLYILTVNKLNELRKRTDGRNESED